jgi:hypothetical protein
MRQSVALENNIEPAPAVVHRPAVKIEKIACA